jgi:two-component system sensor histidine kinase DegS
VRVARKGGRIHVTVRDDGVGFDATSPSAAPELGLVTMRERASLLGAELVIRSRRGHGTEVHVEVPISGAATP